MPIRTTERTEFSISIEGDGTFPRGLWPPGWDIDDTFNGDLCDPDDVLILADIVRWAKEDNVVLNLDFS